MISCLFADIAALMLLLTIFFFLLLIRFDAADVSLSPRCFIFCLLLCALRLLLLIIVAAPTLMRDARSAAAA